MVRQRIAAATGSGGRAEQSRVKTATDSQQMLAFGTLLQLQNQKPNNEELDRFREQVKSDRLDCENELQQHIKTAEEAAGRRERELADTILQSVAPKSSSAKAKVNTSYYTGTQIASNTTFADIQDMLTSSNHLITEYLRLDAIIAEMRDRNTGPNADAWAQGIEDTEEQLRMGARVATRRVKKVLGADVSMDEGEEDGEGGDAENLDEELTSELQKSLSYAERGIRRMVKALPEDGNW